MGDCSKLAVWNKGARGYAERVPRNVRLPRNELYGLTSQSRRAAYSVPANIAEGCGKNSDAEVARHARKALGSSNELSYYLILAHDLTYRASSAGDDLQGDVSEVRGMLAALERVSAMSAERRSPPLASGARAQTQPPSSLVPATEPALLDA